MSLPVRVIRCPVCKIEMIHQPERCRYQCPRDRSHTREIYDGARDRTDAEAPRRPDLPAGEYRAQAVSFTRAQEWNAKHAKAVAISIAEQYGPLNRAPQASQEGDGRTGWGPAGKKGGGGKSRKRKKKPKKGPPQWFCT